MLFKKDNCYKSPLNGDTQNEVIYMRRYTGLMVITLMSIGIMLILLMGMMNYLIMLSLR